MTNILTLLSPNYTIMLVIVLKLILRIRIQPKERKKTYLLSQ